MVRQVGSPTCIVHADVTLTRSKVKVKVKVTGLLNFRKLLKSCMLAAMTVRPFAGLSGYICTIYVKLSHIVLKGVFHCAENRD